MLLEIINVVLWATSATYRTDIGLAAAILSCISALGVIFILYSEHAHSVQPSTFLSVFFSITIFLDIARTRSYFLREGLVAIGGLSVGIVLLKITIVLLEEISKKRLVTTDAANNASYEAFSGFWNRALFLWLNSTFVQGFKTILTVDDLPDLPPELQSEHLANEFFSAWEATDKSSKYSLPRTCIKAYGARWMLPTFLQLCIVALSYTQPFLIQQVMLASEEPVLPQNTANGLIGAFALVYFCSAIFQNFFQHHVNRAVVRLRGYLLIAIFKKILKLDYSIAKQSAALTLMSADLANIEVVVANMQYTWFAGVD